MFNFQGYIRMDSLKLENNERIYDGKIKILKIIFF